GQADRAAERGLLHRAIMAVDVARRTGERTAMRAVLCKELGPPSALVVEERPDPLPGRGEVVIGLRAAGVNFPATLIVQGKYQFKPELPFSPGGEVAGVVEAVGEGVEGLSVGDRVLGTMLWGGYAEKVAV